MSLSREFHQRIGSSFQTVTEQGEAWESQLSPKPWLPWYRRESLESWEGSLWNVQWLVGRSYTQLLSRLWACTSNRDAVNTALRRRHAVLINSPCSHTAPAEGVLKTSSERWQEVEASLSLNWHLMEASRVTQSTHRIQSPFWVNYLVQKYGSHGFNLVSIHLSNFPPKIK